MIFPTDFARAQARLLIVGVIAVALVSALVGCGGGGGSAPGETAITDESVMPTTDGPPPTFFARDSFWNAPLAADAPIDPTSIERVAELTRQVDGAGAWINTDQFSTPIYTVPADQPTESVTLPEPGCCPLVESHLEEVPIPPDARAADGADGHLTIWQPSTDTLWEFWQFSGSPGNRKASYGGRLEGVSQSDGVLPVGGATATALPVVGGTILIEEAQAGVIPHALAMAIPEPQKQAFVAPARRTDGDGALGIPFDEQIPEGSHFRLPADIDIESQDWRPFTKVIARAARDYGIVLRDKGGVVVLFGEDHREGEDPWPAIMGTDPGSILRDFPWDELQLLELGQVYGD